MATGQPLHVFVCLGKTSLLNNLGHIKTVPACSSEILTNVLPHWTIPCRRHRTWHPIPSQYTDTGPTCCRAID